MTSGGVECHIRIRPVQTGSIWSASDSLLYCTQRPDSRFMFHRVHPPSATNATMYQTVEPLVHAAFGGTNVTLMSYGNTGSGKTHSILGTAEDPGLVKRAARTLVELVHSHTIDSATLTCGYIEIYNEIVTDLLCPDYNLQQQQQQNQQVFGSQSSSSSKYNNNASSNNANNNNSNNNNNGPSSELMIREAPDGSAILPDRNMVGISYESDFTQAVNKAESNRRYAETAWNQNSSRSHVVLTFEISRNIAGRRQTSLLQFVDLAGSECAGKSNTEGSALREGGYINKSLLTLGNVVDAIVDGRSHIPFRESKLTRILRNCIGGKSLTFLICCVNPTKENYEQTITSLRFATRAMKVTSDPGLVLNMAPLVCHAVARSVRIREKEMALLEDLAYQRGIQDTYMSCRETVGNVMAEFDAQAQEIFREQQKIADTVVAHDQQRALHAIQDAQQVVRFKNTTLAESEEILENERTRAEKIANRRFEVDELRSEFESDSATANNAKEQLEIDRAELEKQREDFFKRQRDMILIEVSAKATEIEREYWQGLNTVAAEHLAALFPGKSPAELEKEPPMTAATTLRTLTQYKEKIAKEKRELEEYISAYATVRGCLDGEEMNQTSEVCDLEDAALAAHIESVEETQRAARAASGRQQQRGGMGSNNNNSVSPAVVVSSAITSVSAAGAFASGGNNNVASSSSALNQNAAATTTTTTLSQSQSGNSVTPRVLSKPSSRANSANNNKNNQQNNNNNNNNNNNVMGSTGKKGGSVLASSTSRNPSQQPQQQKTLRSPSPKPQATKSSTSTNQDASFTSSSSNNNNNTSNVLISNTLRQGGPRATLEALRTVQQAFLSAEDRAVFEQEVQHQQQQQLQQQQAAAATTTADRATVNLSQQQNQNQNQNNQHHHHHQQQQQHHNNNNYNHHQHRSTGSPPPSGNKRNNSQNQNNNQTGRSNKFGLPLSPKPRERETDDGQQLHDLSIVSTSGNNNQHQQHHPQNSYSTTTTTTTTSNTTTGTVPPNTAARAAARRQQAQQRAEQLRNSNNNASPLSSQNYQQVNRNSGANNNNNNAVVAQKPGGKKAVKNKPTGKNNNKVQQKHSLHIIDHDDEDEDENVQNENDDDDDEIDHDDDENDEDEDVPAISPIMAAVQARRRAAERALFQSPTEQQNTALVPSAAATKNTKKRGGGNRRK